MMRTETVMGVIAGLAAGYVLWLLAFSIADDNADVGGWGPIVLVLSVALGIGAVLWGSVLRRRRRYVLSALIFGLPVLPVALSLAVLADVYF